MALYNISGKQEFEDKVLNNDKLVLVDFWAGWCGPCLAMAPVLKDVAENHGDLMDIVKIDIEASVENQALAGEYDVRSIPNMPLFKGGKEIERIIGMVPKANLVDMATKLAKIG